MSHQLVFAARQVFRSALRCVGGEWCLLVSASAQLPSIALALALAERTSRSGLAGLAPRLPTLQQSASVLWLVLPSCLLLRKKMVQFEVAVGLIFKGKAMHTFNLDY